MALVPHMRGYKALLALCRDQCVEREKRPIGVNAACTGAPLDGEGGSLSAETSAAAESVLDQSVMVRPAIQSDGATFGWGSGQWCLVILSWDHGGCGSGFG